MAGAGVAEELIESGGVDLLVTGDMGIGNTTPAACLIAAFTGRPAEEVTGRGTGIDDATFELKVGVVRDALALHEPDAGGCSRSSSGGWRVRARGSVRCHPRGGRSTVSPLSWMV